MQKFTTLINVLAMSCTSVHHGVCHSHLAAGGSIRWQPTNQGMCKPKSEAKTEVLTHDTEAWPRRWSPRPRHLTALRWPRNRGAKTKATSLHVGYRLHVGYSLHNFACTYIHTSFRPLFHIWTNYTKGWKSWVHVLCVYTCYQYLPLLISFSYLFCWLHPSFADWVKHWCWCLSSVCLSHSCISSFTVAALYGYCGHLVIFYFSLSARGPIDVIEFLLEMSCVFW